MFARFKLNLHDWEITTSSLYEIEYETFSNDYETKISRALYDYLSPNGKLDASKIENDWFPKINANVFLSHSHKDEDKVKALAGMLYKKYGIKSFIDSTVWGYADNLLGEIDEEYCEPTKNNHGGNSYSYKKRNQSTAHVHLLLQGALAKMINDCECIIFVNTPNSLNVSDISNENLTSSPWIYSELLMANIFPPRKPEEYGITVAHRIDEYVEHGGIDIDYKVDLEGFKEINLNDFQKAFDAHGIKSARSVLNQLYLNKGLIERPSI